MIFLPNFVRDFRKYVKSSFMGLLISTKNLRKNVGDRDLFENLSIGIEDGQKIALIGPNGSGKSSLLRLLALQDQPDEGDVVHQKSLQFAFVEQQENFPENMSLLNFLVSELKRTHNFDEMRAQINAATQLSICGFEKPEQEIKELSGGWRKRLAIALALASEPELLILDEPTNHMDWDGILWLEDLLLQFKGAFILVSHDRKVLEKCTNRIIEINPVYQNAYLAFDCKYEEFEDKKEEYIQGQISLQESLSNKARRELDWLRAGVKARTTKSRSRINEAHQLFDKLNQVKQRNLSGQKSSRIEIESTGRKTKKMLWCEDLVVGYEDKKLIDGLSLELGANTCMALVGNNGSGKTSFLKCLSGQSQAMAGEIHWAENLQIVYFDQKRESIDLEKNIVEFLGDGSDYVVFKDKSIHVASYASRFLFPNEKLHTKIKKMSGGEKARLILAKMLLRPADILILDEPTNDLDIDTISLLEDILLEFPGLVILVSHDRSFLDKLSHRTLALNGDGSFAIYADVAQWLKDRKKAEKNNVEAVFKEKKNKPKNKKIKLSFKEKHFLEGVEELILEKESVLEECKAKLEDPEITKDHEKINAVMLEMADLQKDLDETYAYWDEIEAKVKQMEES